jgi:hypothetical protein
VVGDGGLEWAVMAIIEIILVTARWFNDEAYVLGLVLVLVIVG